MREETPNKRSSSSGWVIGVALVLIFYFLAPGPVVLLINKGVIKENSMVLRVYRIGWRPLQNFYNSTKPVKLFYDDYFKALGINHP